MKFIDQKLNRAIMDTLPEIPSEQQLRMVLRSYFERHSLVYNQIHSFDYLMEYTIPKIINENNYIEVIHAKQKVKHVVLLNNPIVCKPMYREHDGKVHDVHPNEILMRKGTYSCTIMVDITHHVYEIQSETIHEPSDEEKLDSPPNLISINPKKTKEYRQIPLFRMPVMVGSKFCHSAYQTQNVLDPYIFGGFFIINGNKKVILPQEKLRINYPFIFKPKHGNKYSMQCQIRSWNEGKIRSTSTLNLFLMASRGGSLPEIFVRVPFIKYDIPLPQVFRILNVNEVENMRRYIIFRDYQSHKHPLDHFIRSVLTDTRYDLNREQLMDEIALSGTTEINRDKRIRYVQNIFNNEFLPHVGLERTEQVHEKRCVYLGHMVRKMLNIHYDPQHNFLDDRDHYSNKRVDTVNMLCGLLFRQLLRAFLKKFTTDILKQTMTNREIYMTDLMMSSKRITSNFKYALSTGNWGMSKGASTQTGVAQIITNISALSMLSHMRRINTPINRDGKMTKPRQLHPSLWGIICCSETPEGASCGLIKNMALLTHIRLGYPSYIIRDFLDSMPKSVKTITSIPSEDLWDWTFIFVDGDMNYAIPHDKAQKLVQLLRKKKRYGDLPFDISVIWDRHHQNIHVNLDSGCCLRPTFVAEHLHKFQHYFDQNVANIWDNLKYNGVIEYLCKEEEETMRIASTLSEFQQDPQAFTHIEIHPMVILGLAASIIPFSNHNQAPRVTYGSVMTKQGIGIPLLNHQDQLDTSGMHEMFYPQKPITSTFIEKTVGLDELPFGTNCIVAIASYTGFNQEDSIILNKASLDRGLFRSMYARTCSDVAKNVGADKESFEIPQSGKVLGMKQCNYEKLNPRDALVDIGEQVRQDDIIIGKVMKGLNDQEMPKDRSTMYKYPQEAVVDRICSSYNKEGALQHHVRLRSERRPKVGDKFSSRHGQKGVCSLILPQEDMPFAFKRGITPDLIINPNAIPSRMTIAQLLETMLGKLAALEGDIGDCTPFTGAKHDQIAQGLKQYGFQPHGEERMINGQTGELMEALIFIGPCNYMRLKHMVNDKLHARATGPCQILTHQPVEGRSRNGGLRFGEMERDMLLSHGASAVVQDRLLYNSDAFKADVCEQCGQIADSAPPRNRKLKRVFGLNIQSYCRRCKTGNHIKKVLLPYAFAVFMRELECCHIPMRFELGKEELD